MTWTKNKPTEDGFYWCKCVGELSGRIHSTVVKVYNKQTAVLWDGSNFHINDESFTMWSDRPIPSPDSQIPIDDAMVERAHDYLNRVDRVMVDRSNVRAALEAAMREGEK